MPNAEFGMSNDDSQTFTAEIQRGKAATQTKADHEHAHAYANEKYTIAHNSIGRSRGR